MAIEWITPKTNWTSTDKFNLVDFNRIHNNMRYLHQRSIEIYGGIYNIDYMGETLDENDDASYLKMCDVDNFNAFEQNLETINSHTLIRDYGVKKTFYANGIFIGFDELNRIESAQLDLYEKFLTLAPSLKVLPIRLNYPYYPFKLPTRNNERPSRLRLPFTMPQKIGGDKRFR